MNKITLNTTLLDKESYKNSKSERRYYITNDVRIIAYDITKPAFDAISIHKYDATSAKLLSESMLSALMISESLKNPNDYINWRLECSGPIGGINVECRKNGQLRGFIVNYPIDTKNFVIRTFSDLFQAGFITVEKYIEGEKEAQKSSVMIERGLIPYETALFFKESEQINSNVGMWVNLKNDKFCSVTGLLIQALPNAKIENLEKIENIVINLNENFNKKIGNIDNLIEFCFKDFKPKFLEKGNIEFFCPCSKEHYVDIIRNLNITNDVFKDDDFLKIKCSMCSSEYKISKNEIIK